MRYTFCIMTTDGRGDLKEMKPLFSTPNKENAERMMEEAKNAHRNLRRKAFARNIRAVVVVGIDRQKHGKSCVQSGRNGLKSRPVQHGQVFRSATEASGYIGLRHNEVAIALSRAAQTGENKATLRGVTFAYRDESKVAS